MTTIIRPATKDDMPALMDMMQGLAGYMNVEGPKHTVEDLYRDGGFDGSFPYFFALIAEDTKVIDSNGSPTAVGCAVFSHIYTWDGRSIHLDTLYINENYRSKGIGRLIFKELMNHAKAIGCNRIEFLVANTNPAQNFYKKLGAINYTERNGHVYYQMGRDVINRDDD